MKRYIKFIPTLLLILLAFTSCDNDATNGILSNIVNSEIQEEYEIKAVAENSAHTTYYSAEEDGIYLTTTSNNERTLILDNSSYPNISSIYIDATNIYFKSTNATQSTLYYFPITTTKISAATAITVEGTFIELTSNGYVVAKNTNYYIHKITDNSAITESVNFASATDDLSDTIVVGAGIILQTVGINSSSEYTYDYYFSTDGSSVTSTSSTDQDNKIISAVLDSSFYYCVLDNADLIKMDATNNTPLYDNSSSSYSFNNESKNMFIDSEDLLIVFDSSNDVLLYDLTNTATDEGFTSLTEGFANVLRNTSDIVGIFEILDGNKYYVATNTNGYYTLSITLATDIEDDDSDNSTCISKFN